MGANNFRSRSVKYCKGLSNRFSLNPSSVLPSCHKGKFFRNPVDRCRGPGIVKERSYSGSQSLRLGLLQPSISCSQERGHLPARVGFEFIKPFCSPRSFSDGGATLFNGTTWQVQIQKTHIFLFQFTNPLKGFFVSSGAQNSRPFWVSLSISVQHPEYSPTSWNLLPPSWESRGIA